MILTNLSDKNYDKDIVPYIRNGVLIDTSVIKILIDGLIEIRFKKILNPEYDKLLKFLNRIKIPNRWKYLITPHVLSETCGHFYVDYNKKKNYKAIVKEVLPILENMEERNADKKEIINFINPSNPVIEIGDLSIFVATKNAIDVSDKIAILSKDSGFNSKYEYNQDVMIFDYDTIVLNSPW
ncbi:MAG: hypothetical protein KJI70_00800 [Patescibacteria group bacterium]|nr:hypothetical protein [Patescibacteria group bacterium]